MGPSRSGSGGILPPLACSLLAALCGVSTLALPARADDPYAPRTVWDEYTHSDLNISVFVYRDANRDGLYDVGDRPMSGIEVEASGMGRPSWATSNSAGFANFTMSGTETDAQIMFEGKYRFDLLVPPHWSVTSGNASQSTHFALMPGSPADLVAKPAPSLVGLAPDLVIAGQVPEDLRASPPAFAAAGEPPHELILDADGRFVIPVAPGTWSLDPAEEQAGQVAVTATPIELSQAWFEAGPPARAKEAKAGFDDLQGEGVLKIPSGYQGLGWENFVMTHQKFYDPEGYRNGVMSGEFVAYNGSGHPAAISRTAGFDFIGGYFGISTLRAEGETLIITAWRGSERAYEQTLTLSALGPVYLAAEFRNITRLQFETAHYWQFTADDLSFRLP